MHILTLYSDSPARTRSLGEARGVGAHENAPRCGWMIGLPQPRARGKTLPIADDRLMTPFGFASTADEVLADVDLSGKRAVVTGAKATSVSRGCV